MSTNEEMLTQARARTLIVGRALLREKWEEMSSEYAHEWCIAKARELGAPNETNEEGISAELIGLAAMDYILQQTGHASDQ